MRKLRRSVLRHYAESKKIKASRYIRETWHKMQSKKYGVDTAALLRNIGTATNKAARARMRLLSRKGVI